MSSVVDPHGEGFQVEISSQISYGMNTARKRGSQMSTKNVSDILKLVEFINEEVRGVSKRLSRVTPREVTEKLGSLALLREKILSLQVNLPEEVEKKLSELYPAIDKIKQKSQQ